MFENKQTTRPVTYNIRSEERRMIDSMAESKGISKSNIAREAFRLYHLVDERLKQKERLAFIAEDGTITKLEVLFNRDIPITPTREEVAAAMFRGCMKVSNDLQYRIALQYLSMQGVMKIGEKSLAEENLHWATGEIVPK